MFSTLKCRRGEMENTMAQERNADVEAMLIGAAHEIRLALNQGQLRAVIRGKGPYFAGLSVWPIAKCLDRQVGFAAAAA
jgi:hypothetical protein